MFNLKLSPLTVTVALVSLIGMSATASAAVITFGSNAGDTCATFAPVVGPCAGAGGTAVEIGVHPAWQPNLPNGVWISFDDTGQPGSISPPNSATPIMKITEIITVGAGGAIDFSFSTWADDTTNVVFDGTEVFVANPLQDGACAAGPIGCEPSELFTFALALLAPGQHTIEWNAYQKGGGPFGLLYAGQYTEEEGGGGGEPGVPEPTTLTIFGIGLLGLGLASRRRRRAV